MLKMTQHRICTKGLRYGVRVVSVVMAHRNDLE